MMHRLNLQHIRNAMPNRPAGYYEDVIRSGALEGNALIMSNEAYTRLCQKYDTIRRSVRAVVINPVPPEQWPLWAQGFKKLAQLEDAGIGDVVRRMIGEETSNAFKMFYRKIAGKDCGCKGRQERWNKLYPLKPTTERTKP